LSAKKYNDRNQTSFPIEAKHSRVAILVSDEEVAHAVTKKLWFFALAEGNVEMLFDFRLKLQ
jgi:hypothetical protein